MARNMAGHVSEAAMPPVAAISIPLMDSVFVTNPGPRSSKKRMRTVRMLGWPSASTVATDSASGSGTSPRSRERACASSTQCRACRQGVGAMSASLSPSPA